MFKISDNIFVTRILVRANSSELADILAESTLVLNHAPFKDWHGITVNRHHYSIRQHFFLLLILILYIFPNQATMDLSSWTPIYKGVEHASGTNSPDGSHPDLQVIHALKVDLRDPDIRFFTTPRIDNYLPDSRETGGLTVSEFLQANHLQVAINANLFDPSEYYLPAGTPMDLHGLAISEGVVVSAQSSAADSSALVFDSQNNASIIHTNWPPTNNAGIFTAVSGAYPIVIKGQNVGSRYLNDPNPIHAVNPRTAFGLSPDRRFLYILAIDGRQAGYSDGADDNETAAWMLLLGAFDAVNMDGGGSTTLVTESLTGQPIRWNSSSAVADSGRERTVGSHFGIFARPVSGFINDVSVQPEDHTATVSWTTLDPANSRVDFGFTESLGTTIGPNSALTTNHTVLLTNLTANTRHYFQISTTNSNTNVVSQIYLFTTTNHVQLSEVFNLTNSWRYTQNDLDGIQWTDPNYNDSSWPAGKGILYAVQSGRTINSAIQPLGAQMPRSPTTTFPFVTYYLRTHFTSSSNARVDYFNVSALIDDGAVFYLNGHEIQRIRMPDTAILNSTLATTTPCSGDATCSDDFSVVGPALGFLQPGDNVIAVEVHNYNLRSHDIVFGMDLIEADAMTPIQPILQTHISENQLVIEWSGNGFVLQESTSPSDGWHDVQPQIISSPFSTPISGFVRYFRLRGA